MAKTRGGRAAGGKRARSGPSRRRRVAPTPDGATEQRILDAARAVFIRSGTAGARMQEIAREAGVNQALLHYYFRSKERLSAAVFSQFAARLFPVLVETLGSDLAIHEKVDRLIALYLDNLARNPFLPGYLIAEMHHHPERLPQMVAQATGADPLRVFPAVLQRLQTQIDAEVKAGKMHPIQAQQFAINLISLAIFPFAARAMICAALGLDAAGFDAFIARRRKELPDFFKRALRP